MENISDSSGSSLLQDRELPFEREAKMEKAKTRKPKGN